MIIFSVLTQNKEKTSLITKEEIDQKILKQCLQSTINNKELTTLLLEASHTHEFDIYLLYGMVKTLSNFDPNLVIVTDDKIFYGLMQLPDSSFSQYIPKQLINPAINLDLGLRYYKKNYRQSNNNHIKALAMLKAEVSKPQKTYGENHLAFVENILKEQADFKLFVDNSKKQNYDLYEAILNGANND